MSLDPAVQEGLAAYRSGDFHAAHLAWERRGAKTTGNPHALLAALADLALALERQAVGIGESARLVAVRERLDDLPSQVLGVDLDRLRGGLPADPAAPLAAPPPIAAAPALPRWAVLRFLAFVAVIVAGFVIFRYTPVGERLNELLDRERLMAIREGLQARWWSGAALVLLYAVLAPLGAPVSPLMLAGGAIFGTWLGALYNFVGTFVGAALSFLLARALGRDLIVHLAGDRLSRAERLITRRGFWPLVRIRFLPIPFPVVNYGAALAGVPASLFLLTTALGLLPANLVFTYFASAMVNAVGGDRAGLLLRMGLAVGGLLALSFLPNLLTGLHRRRRYRELRERRGQIQR